MAAGTHDRMVCDLIPVYLDNEVLTVCPDAWPGEFDTLHVTPPIDGVAGAHYKGVPVAKLLPTDRDIVTRLYTSMFVGNNPNVLPLHDLRRTSCLDWRDNATQSGGINYVHQVQNDQVFHQLFDNKELAQLPTASTVGVIMPDSYQEWFRRGKQPTVIRQGAYWIRWYTVCFSGVVRQPTDDYKGEHMQFVSPHGSVAVYRTWKNVR
jgi:hypothetical protein